MLLTKSVHKISGDPDLVASSLGSLVEDLVLPRTEHDLSIGAFDVQTSIDADVEMRIHDVSSGDSLGADAAVVGALWTRVKVSGWPSDWVTGGVVDQDVFLFETEPKIVVVVVDLSSGVGGVWSAVWVHDFAHDNEGVLSAWIVADVAWDEETVGAVSWGLLSGAAIEAPLGAIFEFSGEVVDNHAFASEELGWFVSIEPKIFELRSYTLLGGFHFLFLL